MAQRQLLTAALLCPLLVCLNGCKRASLPPGEVVCAEMKKSGFVFHHAIAPVKIESHAHPRQNPAVTLDIDGRHISADTGLTLFTVGDPEFKPPAGFLAELYVRGANVEFSKHITAKTPEELLKEPDHEVGHVGIGNWHGGFPSHLTAVTIRSNEPVAFSSFYHITSHDFDFMHIPPARPYGPAPWQFDHGTIEFEQQLSKALVSAGYESDIVSRAVTEARSQLLALSERDFLRAALATDQAELAKQTGLTAAIREAYLACTTHGPEWAISTTINGREVIAYKRTLREVYPFIASYDEFDDNGRETSYGTLMLRNVADQQGLADEILQLYGENVASSTDGTRPPG